jgi:hypothetical protein
MDLLKTTILPSDSDAAAQLFRKLVFDTPVVLLVVLGTGAVAEGFVQRADQLAGTPTEPRRVVWAREPNHIAQEVSALGNNPGVAPPIQGFSIPALTNNIADVIQGNTVPDLLRIFEAFARAEAA